MAESSYPPESCKDNPHEVLTTTCKPVPLDGGTIGTVAFPPHVGDRTVYAQFGGTSIYPAQFPTYADYERYIEDSIKTQVEYRAKAQQREQERYEHYLASRTRWQAFRDGVRAQKRLLQHVLYGFAIAVFGACLIGGLVLIVIAIGQILAAVLAGNWLVITLATIALAFIALIVAVHIDDGKDY